MVNDVLVNLKKIFRSFCQIVSLFPLVECLSEAFLRNPVMFASFWKRGDAMHKLEPGRVIKSFHLLPKLCQQICYGQAVGGVEMTILDS